LSSDNKSRTSCSKKFNFIHLKLIPKKNIYMG
jgi:hypothetical protein